MADNAVEQSLRRLTRIEETLQAQLSYIQRVPDPDNRYRAETNLLTLLEMRDTTREHHDVLVARADPGRS